MKLIKIFITILILLNVNIALAIDEIPILQEKEIVENKTVKEDIEINYNKNIPIGESFKLDLTGLKEELEKKYDSKISFEWSVKGTTTRKGEVFERNFENFGEKNINVSIFTDEKGTQRLIYNKQIDIFVFTKSIPFIFENNINKEVLKNFMDSSKNNGIYIYTVGITTEKNLKNNNFTNNIFSYNNTNGKKSDYIGIWGEKDFVLSVVSKIDDEFKLSKIKNNLNLVLISSFNIDILKNYLNNFLANKKWANNVILIDESSKFQIINQTEKIDILENELKKNKYFYFKINKEEKINKWFFIGNFINNLSGKGFNTSEIYLILIIPFLLTIISFMKHFIGLSPIGIIIPLSITLLIFRVGLVNSAIFISILLIVNIIFGKIVNRYNILYVPKISFVLITNFIVFMILINTMYDYNLLEINSSDMIFIFLLIIVSERLLSILLSKEIFDYTGSFINTIIFGVVSFYLFSYDLVKILILAYPEIIIILIPINFMIGRFTGLRITEYFRFREIIKSVEE